MCKKKVQYFAFMLALYVVMPVLSRFYDGVREWAMIHSTLNAGFSFAHSFTGFFTIPPTLIPWPHVCWNSTSGIRNHIWNVRRHLWIHWWNMKRSGLYGWWDFEWSTRRSIDAGLEMPRLFTHGTHLPAALGGCRTCLQVNSTSIFFDFFIFFFFFFLFHSLLYRSNEITSPMWDLVPGYTVNHRSGLCRFIQTRSFSCV